MSTLWLLLLSSIACGSSDDAFEKEVRPLLEERCLSCHGERRARSGLRLDSREAILKGGDRGPGAVPFQPEQSRIIEAVRGSDDLAMPPRQRLEDSEIDALVRWVERGLPWSDVARPRTKVTKGETFWSFRPVEPVAVPGVADTAWPRNDIDRFVLARIEAAGLQPAAEADRRTWIRRATFDLIGLPPTAAEVEAFLGDETEDAYARVIDRLLASPHYGERWARHWLDVVRYTDSFDARGIGGEGDVSEAWRYRDWVVAAFNRDLPYDQFIIQQVAGDLLARQDGFDSQRVIATGLLAIGNWGGGDADKEKLLTDIADDQLDVVSRAFLGLTLACARCHDHKFDPLTTRDYYAIAGMFFSSHILPSVGPKTAGPPMLRIPLLSPEELARRSARQERLQHLSQRLGEITNEHRAAFARAQLAATDRYVRAVFESDTSLRDLDGLAQERGLIAAVLRQWSERLGLGSGKMLRQRVQDLAGIAGIHALRNETDTPSALVNVNRSVIPLSTLQVPPRAVTVHPSPAAGVAVIWTSPIEGTVRIRARLQDADSVCGDGVDWELDLWRGRGSETIARGSIPNGGAADLLAESASGAALERVVRPGDRLRVVVMPKAEYTCDTTAVELIVEEVAGSEHVWQLSDELVSAAEEDRLENPLSDRYGNAATWQLLDLGESILSAPSGSALSDLLALAARRRAGDALAPEDLEATLAGLESELGANGPTAELLAGASGPYWLANAGELSRWDASLASDLAPLEAERRELESNPPPPIEYANGVQEGGVPDSPQAGVHDVPVHIRGRYDRLGDVVPRGFPEALGGGTLTRPEESGRLELARWIARPEHPLTARVMVNRIWQHHFGGGLVATPGNFGALGMEPTHPELLDHLARRFVESGWSIRALHRELMLSATYRQSSLPSPESLAADPGNRLLTHMRRRRLEAEELRDAMLAVAGSLDRTLGGPAIRDEQSRRRTLYVMTVRSDRSTFRELFDAADPTAIQNRRIESTTAPQSLFFLNDPLARQQSRRLAERLMGSAEGRTERIALLTSWLFARPPKVGEVEVLNELLGPEPAAVEAWTQAGQVMLCTNEWMYVD